ncbi:MAG: hypothetical protein V3S24_22980 [Candidatus Tectomicrobia bacterium]
MAATDPTPADLIEVDDSPRGVYEHFYRLGWTDGLPVIPPTDDLVQEMLQYTDRAADDVVAQLPPKQGDATVERIAINAVMAGCRAEYMPVLIPAIEAMMVPHYNLYGRQTTTHPGAHLMLINGPIARELDVNARFNVFGQGWRANATLGRALRLLLINVGGGIPGVTDMATHGHPGKYGYTIAEHEDASPWAPFHVDRGHAPETSTVTMLCAEAPHNINDQVSKTPELYLGSAASAMAHLGGNPLYRSGLDTEHMLVVTAETAQWLAEHGWSKHDVSAFLFQEARQPLRLLRDRGGWELGPLAPDVDTDDDDAMVPIVSRPEDILIVVAGGPGRHMNAVLTSSYTKSVTRAITRHDGTPIRSCSDFLR